MFKSLINFTFIASLLTLTACATFDQATQPTAQIIFAPAIDVPYNEVVDKVKEHLGVRVRWGGQIIAADDVKDAANETLITTRLTVFAFPLSDNGKPDLRSKSNSEGGRFIVEMKDFDESDNNQFITVFGQITGEEVLTNGNKQKVIPVVTAIESMTWDSSHRKTYVRFRHGLPYNGLGYPYGYDSRFSYYGGTHIGIGYGWDFYPYGYGRYGRRFGHHGGHH